MLSVLSLLLLLQVAPSGPAFLVAQMLAPAPLPGMQIGAVVGIIGPGIALLAGI